MLCLQTINACLNSTIPGLKRGGRYTECSLSCEESYSTGYLCYSDIPVSYDIWWSFTFFGFVTGFIWSSYCLFVMMKTDKMTIRLTPQYITIIVNMIVQVLRIIWLLCIINGRTPDDIFGGIVLENTLVKLGQCLMFTEFFTIILVWKGIVDRTTTMKIISKKDEYRSYRNTIMFSVILVFAVFPLSVMGYLINTIFYTISNLILMAFVTGLIIGGIIYSSRITKALENGLQKGNRKDVVRNIRFIIRIFTFLGSLCFILTIFNSVSLLNSLNLKVWVWWFSIHTNEIIFLNLLAYSVSQKARIAIRSHRTISSVFSEPKRIGTGLVVVLQSSKR